MNFEALRRDLNQLINNLETFKRELRPGDYSNKVVCAKVDLGHLIRDLRRGETFLDRYVALVADDRWADDKEAGAIG